MTLTRRSLLISLSFLIASCGSISNERSSDASTVSTCASGAYSDVGITSRNTLYFAYDKSDVTAQGRAKIRSLAKIINKEGLSVRIEGHCDERGTREYNLALGERRTNNILNYLIVSGAARNQIEIVSYGEERPADRGASETAYQRNRRVEIVIQ